MLNISEMRVRDPFIVTEEDAYYLFGSTDFNQKNDRTESLLCYRSTDLINFENPVKAFTPEPDFWSDMHYWAPEVHFYHGKYYMFASFKSETRCRGTQIFISDNVRGPYKPLTDGPFTPSDWECLDGTLFIDNGVPYAVFCHEWLQVGDGEISAVRLSDDLKTATSEPVLLFKASQAPWTVSHAALKDGTKAYITDGPFVYMMKNGSLLMIWSSFSASGYAVGQAVSKSGIFGPWKQVEKPLFENDGGHGMLFYKKDGTLWLSIHYPNRMPDEHPVFIEVEEADEILRLK